jgi:hypothetical protein
MNPKPIKYASMKRMNKILIICLFGLSALLSACKNENDKDGNILAGSVLILNQGAFTQGNASITRYNPATRTVESDVFFRRNGRPLGDVLQSATRIGNELYLVVNNSRKIEVVDAETIALRRTIALPSSVSPRYLAASDASTAWVTSLFSDYIYKINLISASVTDSVLIGAGTEDINFSNGRLFVARNLNADFSTASGVAVVNPTIGIVESVIPTCAGPQRILTLGMQLWVNCTGNFGASDGGLVRIDPATRASTLEVPLMAGISGMAASSARNELYILSDGVWRVPVNDVSTRSRITSRYFYGIGVYEKNETIIYAADAKNFSTEGSVIMFNSNGVPVDSVVVGVVPADFYFYD